MPDEDLEELANEAKNYPYPQPSEIDVDFFDIYKHSKKEKILFNTDKEFSYSDKEEIVYVLKEPTYISFINITFQKDCKVKDTKILFLKPNGSNIEYELRDNSENVELPIKTVVTEIVFIPPKSFYIKKEKLHFQTIEVYGRTESELSNLENSSKEIDELYEKLKTEAAKVISINRETLIKIQKAQEDLTSEHTNLDEEIASFKDELEALKAIKTSKEEEVKIIEKNLTELKGQTAQVQNNHDSLVAKEQTLNDSIEQKKFLITDLNSKIVKTEQELREKDERKSLLAYDVEGFVENAKSNIKVYIGLSALPWILICVVTYFLFKNTEVLAAIYQLKKEDVDLVTIFWSRLPFAMIVSSILFVSYEISISFANKIIDLHQRILDLQKIGIIARDVSEASLTNLDEFTKEEKFELRTKLKMDLLRSHLAKDFDTKDPTKEPFKVSNPHTWIRFLKAKESPKDKVPQEEPKEKPEDNE